jgi:hypothetical protein
VVPGDTLFSIAAAHATDWQTLHGVNAALIGADAGQIFPGQVLVLP